MTQFTIDTNGKPLTVTIPIATLEQLVVALEKHHKQETRYSDNKRRANATCAHFTVNPLQELAEQAYMLTHGQETIEAITAGRAALANAEPTQSKPYAWRNPMNGVVISNDKKERLLCVGRGYPNFSEPLYVAGAKP